MIHQIKSFDILNVKAIHYHTMKSIFTIGILFIALTGCATMKELPTAEQATAIEQLLMTQAVELSLNGQDATSLPLPKGASIQLETMGLTVDQRFLPGAVGGLTGDQRFLLGAVGRWLGEQGLRVPPDGQEATYKIRVMVQTLGTEQSRTFFGMPPVTSVLIPFSLPAITIYGAQYQSGYTRFRLDIFERSTGQFIRSTPWMQSRTFYNEYSLLFFIDFHRTNLLGPFEDFIPLKSKEEVSTEDSE